MFALIVSVHSLWAQKFIVKWTMIGQMVIAKIALPRFNDLGRSVTPVFLLVEHFLYRFATFSEKMKKVFRSEVWFFVQNALSNSVLFSFCSSLRRLQMPLEGLSFVKTLTTFRIITTPYPLLENMTKNICLHWPFIYIPVDHAELHAPIRIIFYTLYIWNEVGNPQFFAFLTQVTHYLIISDGSKN